MSRIIAKKTKNLQSEPKFWGHWGGLNPAYGKEFLRQTYNRGFGQPALTGPFHEFYDQSSWVSYFARRYNHEWLRLVAMRIDSQRTPLIVLRRQIWLARFEYWYRKISSMRQVYRSAQVEWAYIKARLAQPMTWTGHDILHFSLWSLQIMFGFCIGESLRRRNWHGYKVGDPSWTPAKPKFAPGFYHVYDNFFENYPHEGQPNLTTKLFGRDGYWPNNPDNYWFPSKMHFYPFG